MGTVTTGRSGHLPTLAVTQERHCPTPNRALTPLRRPLKPRLPKPERPLYSMVVRLALSRPGIPGMHAWRSPPRPRQLDLHPPQEIKCSAESPSSLLSRDCSRPGIYPPPRPDPKRARPLGVVTPNPCGAIVHRARLPQAAPDTTGQFNPCGPPPLRWAAPPSRHAWLVA